MFTQLFVVVYSYIWLLQTGYRFYPEVCMQQNIAPHQNRREFHNIWMDWEQGRDFITLPQVAQKNYTLHRISETADNSNKRIANKIRKNFVRPHLVQW